jgi:tRNA nucleotidyltransferase (CCA-adding enzyme)
LQVKEVIEYVLKRVTPQKDERRKVETLSKNMEDRILSASKSEGFPAIVRVEGSVAKNTWISGSPDIDVFLRLPTSIPRKDLGEIGLRIARKAAAKDPQLERFAEHPYLEVLTDGYRVDIVPCYNAEPGKWQSATDRTPYHTDYIKQRLSTESIGEVRLLKKFMEGIRVYGAEIKIGGFSGYLCELLVMKFHTFLGVLEAFSSFNRRLVIDLENYYDHRQDELTLLFPELLVIIDPVDKARNVASAVLPEKLYTLIAASRVFLESPSLDFFYPEDPKPYSAKKLKSKLKTRGSSLIFVVTKHIQSVPDILWGQLYKSKRSLAKLLTLNDFVVLKSAVWSDEKGLSVFVLEIESQTLNDVRRHFGPPLERQAESKKFLAKYVGNKSVLSGPYIEDGRWIVELHRNSIDAASLLEKITSSRGNFGATNFVALCFKNESTVLVNDKVEKMYVENREFAVFLTEFLIGRPFWLQSSSDLKLLSN